jgi:hypothetical protein
LGPIQSLHPFRATCFPSAGSFQNDTNADNNHEKGAVFETTNDDTTTTLEALYSIALDKSKRMFTRDKSSNTRRPKGVMRRAPDFSSERGGRPKVIFEINGRNFYYQTKGKLMFYIEICL